MPAEEILDVVFGRRQQHVKTGLVHQPVELSGVERSRFWSFADVEHMNFPEAQNAFSPHSSKPAEKDEPARAVATAATTSPSLCRRLGKICAKRN